MILDLTQEDDHSDIDEGQYKRCSQNSQAPPTSARLAPSHSLESKSSSNEPFRASKFDEDDEDDELLFSSPIFARKHPAKPNERTIRKKSSDLGKKTPVKKKIVNKNGATGSTDVTSKASNVDAVKEKKTKKELERKQKALQKAEREMEKQKKKELERERKALQKAEREMEKQLQLQKKKRLIQHEKQANGKFCGEEIGVYLDEYLSSCEEFGESLISALEETKNSVTVAKRHSGANVVEGCIQWVRRDYLKGGSTSALNDIREEKLNKVEWMDTVAFVFRDSIKFLELLEQDENDIAGDQFPLLESWLQEASSLIKSRNSTSTRKPRIILVLHRALLSLSLQWKQGGKRRDSFSPTNEEELHDAITWLLMEKQIECHISSNETETVEFIVSLTRALSELPYYENPTELHCIKKIKLSSKNGSPIEKAKDCWKRQLQQIPGLSEAKATYLMTFYPTARSLIDEYQDPNLTENEKCFLLTDCFQEGRSARKMSENVYHLMNSKDETELL